jgi:hypothetical protein
MNEHLPPDTEHQEVDCPWWDPDWLYAHPEFPLCLSNNHPSNAAKDTPAMYPEIATVKICHQTKENLA